jgi:hypothetical protein
MYRHHRFLTMIVWLAVMLASGCSPSAIPDASTHPADPRAPVGAAAPASADAPEQTTPDAAHQHGSEPEPEPEPEPDHGHGHGEGHEHDHH